VGRQRGKLWLNRHKKERGSSYPGASMSQQQTGVFHAGDKTIWGRTRKEPVLIKEKGEEEKGTGVSHELVVGKGGSCPPKKRKGLGSGSKNREFDGQQRSERRDSARA